jgi:hypothetical protein
MVSRGKWLWFSLQKRKLALVFPAKEENGSGFPCKRGKWLRVWPRPPARELQYRALQTWLILTRKCNELQYRALQTAKHHKEMQRGAGLNLSPPRRMRQPCTLPTRGCWYLSTPCPTTNHLQFGIYERITECNPGRFCYLGRRPIVASFAHEHEPLPLSVAFLCSALSAFLSFFSAFLSSFSLALVAFGLLRFLCRESQRR